MSSMPNMPPSMPNMQMGTSPHRGGLIMGLGIGALASQLIGCLSGLIFPLCGMIGFVGLVLAIVAWVMASGDIKAMNAGHMDPAGLGNTKVGRVCAIITISLIALSIIVGIVLLLAGVAIFGGLLAGAAAAGQGANP